MLVRGRGRGWGPRRIGGGNGTGGGRREGGNRDILGGGNRKKLRKNLEILDNIYAIKIEQKGGNH